MGEQYGVKSLAHYSKPKRREILKTYYKFMFVRHPFDRVQAAYLDKLVAEMFYGKPGNYYKNLLPVILEKVRVFNIIAKYTR